MKGLCILITLGFLLGLAKCDLSLQMLTPADSFARNARCMDGTPYGYYFEKGANTSRFIVWQDMGGFCDTIPQCQRRLGTVLGTSAVWPKTLHVGTNLLSRNCDYSPFCDWSFILIPYCTGDFHSGTRTDPYQGLYFSGRHNVEAAISHAAHSIGLDSATDIVLTGSSTGGYATFVNLDMVAARFPNARVVGLPQAGYFLWTLTYDEWMSKTQQKVESLSSHQKVLRGPRQQTAIDEDALTCDGLNTKEGGAMVALSDLHAMWNSYVHPACASNTTESEQWRCMVPPYLVKYIKTPLFLAENTWDADQLFIEEGAPVQSFPFSEPLSSYVQYFGKCMANKIDTVWQSATAGAFLPSCLAHCIPTQGPTKTLINGLGLVEVFANWYWNLSGPQKLQDTCEGPQCNPTCGAVYQGPTLSLLQEHVNKHPTHKKH